MAEDIKYQINGLPADNIVNIIGSDARKKKRQRRLACG